MHISSGKEEPFRKCSLYETADLEHSDPNWRCVLVCNFTDSSNHRSKMSNFSRYDDEYQLGVVIEAKTVNGCVTVIYYYTPSSDVAYACDMRGLTLCTRARGREILLLLYQVEKNMINGLEGYDVLVKRAGMTHIDMDVVQRHFKTIYLYWGLE